MAHDIRPTARTSLILTRNIQHTISMDFFIPVFATLPGAVFIDNALLVIVTGVMTLEGNSAPGGFGGGLYVARAIKMEVSRGYFMSNSAAFGGAIASLSSGLPSYPILYSECSFTENSAEKDGGAIYSVASYDALNNVEMDGNFAGKSFFGSRV